MSKNAFKLKNLPPRGKGEITVGTTENGFVAFIADEPITIFTPEQARSTARLLMEKADIADEVLRRASN